MYWKDSPNILADLNKFSALYIKVHGCVWSEYGLGNSFDDDGENHDGDGTWYMTRVQTFRANAAFSLYGTLREDGAFSGGGCKKKTYINSFFTYLGADTIVNLLELGVSAFPDYGYGSNACYEYYDDSENNNDNNGKDNHFRDLKSGSHDNNADKMSTTMGCAFDGTFANAKFLGSDCDGHYFLNTTDDLEDYNTAMEKVSCRQVWNYNKEYTGSRALKQNYDLDNVATTYGSVAEKLLLTSFACDLDLYPEACPDPFGLKAMYTNNMKHAVSAKSFVGNVGDWQKPIQFISFAFLVASVCLGLYSYFLKNQKYIKHEGGGAKGMAKLMWSDVKGSVVKTTSKALSRDKKEVDTAKSSKKKMKKTKKMSKTSKSGRRITEKNDAIDDMNFVSMPDDAHIENTGSFKTPSLSGKDSRERVGSLKSPFRFGRNSSERSGSFRIPGILSRNSALGNESDSQSNERHSSVKGKAEDKDMVYA